MAAKKRTSRTTARARRAPRETTTVRIDVDTHGELMELAAELDLTTGALIAKLLRHYRSKIRHEEAARQLREMKNDPEVWADFLNGKEVWPEIERLKSRGTE